MTASSVRMCAGYKLARSGQSEASLVSWNTGMKVAKCGVHEGPLPTEEQWTTACTISLRALSSLNLMLLTICYSPVLPPEFFPLA